MKKFQFRLEPVLKHRESCEEMAAQEQARVLREYQQNYAVLQEAREKLARAAQGCRVMDQFDLINMQAYCNYMSDEVQKREIALYNTSQKLEESRKKLIKAMQDKSVVARLKENQLHCYNRQLLACVQKENDEIAIQQFIRRVK